MIEKITLKQKNVLDYINAYILNNGISPTIEEIRKKLRLKAVSTVHEHIKSLQKKGYLDKDRNIARSIEMKSNNIEKIINIPIVGMVSPEIKDPNPYFTLRVSVAMQVIKNIPISKKKHTKNKKNLRTIDLFAGIGGIRLGFERAGFETVFANDFEINCKSTYDLNFKTTKLIIEDIRKLDIYDLPEFDFLLGGFPCQAFSIAGYRHGFKDKKDRGNLFFDIARIIELKKPSGFLLENVKNLKSHDGGKTFKIIEETLNNLGYHLKVKVLNSMDYGNIPQNRERIYIVGFKNKSESDKFEFPDKIKLTSKITDLLEKNVPDKYYYNDKPLFQKLKNHIVDENKVYQWRRRYVRENKKGVCPTLTANMGMGGHNVPIIKDKKGIRKLTPLECARIQGFPDNYKLPQIADSTLYKQFGNSVSVPVIEAIAKKIIEAIN